MHVRPLIFRTLTLAIVLAVSHTAHAQFVFDITQGGWVDEHAGLVWGYNVACSGSASLNATYGGAVWHADNYVDLLAVSGQSHADRGDAALATAIEAELDGDQERADFYYELAEYHYFLADKLFEASAAVAPENVPGWRLPTLDEIQAAWSQGLFDIERTPIMEPGYECFGYPQGNRWTSTKRGKNFVFVFQPSTGDVRTIDITRTSIAMPIVVRSLNADTGGGGPGNGNGNGKGK